MLQDCPGRKLGISYMATWEMKVSDASASVMMDCESAAANERVNEFAKIFSDLTHTVSNHPE